MTAIIDAYCIDVDDFHETKPPLHDTVSRELFVSWLIE